MGQGFESLWAHHTWWLWRSWLARQIVALEAVGSSPTSHPTEKADPGCYAARFPLFLFSGLSPSGKARDFDSRMRGFESRHPNQPVANVYVCDGFLFFSHYKNKTGSFRQESGRFSFFRNILRMGA